MRTLHAAILGGVLAAGGPAAGQDQREYTDGHGDAVVRRTDSGNNGPINPDAVLPDVVRVRLAAWHAPNAAADPYTGSVIDDDDAELFRIQIVFAGLVNPAGPIGLGGQPYDPFRFGPSPVLGFLELNADRRDDSGGQIGGAAEQRFLANVGRFGEVPGDSIAGNMATRGLAPGSCGDYDLDFWTPPFFERSGEDFAIVLCGCHPVTVVQEGGDQDGVFEAGETWVVESRYFQRAAGYQGASAVFGGSDFGLYDPITRLQFRHDAVRDETTITLVEALTMRGAALLRGEPEQPMDLKIDIDGSHHSVAEAVQDIIDGANAGLSGPVRVLAERWRGRDVDEAFEPSRWEVAGIFGTAYAQPQDGLYVWTDVGFDTRRADFDHDAAFTGADEAIFDAFLASADGGACDHDGTANGTFVVDNLGPNFSVYDMDYDGKVGLSDRRRAFCRADLTGSNDPASAQYGVPDGAVDTRDFFYFLDQYASQNLAGADLTGGGAPGTSRYAIPDGQVSSADFFFFLDMYVLGCD